MRHSPTQGRALSRSVFFPPVYVPGKEARGKRRTKGVAFIARVNKRVREERLDERYFMNDGK